MGGCLPNRLGCWSYRESNRLFTPLVLPPSDLNPAHPIQFKPSCPPPYHPSLNTPPTPQPQPQHPLQGHLVGQFPDRWRCAGLRNPVLNIALMVGVTDIPDWCYIETMGTEVGGCAGGWGWLRSDVKLPTTNRQPSLFLPFATPHWHQSQRHALTQPPPSQPPPLPTSLPPPLFQPPSLATPPSPNHATTPPPQEGLRRYRPDPTPEDLALFAAASPIAHVHRVRAPLAFMLGAKDRRVPLEDGRRYIDAVRALGVPTRVLSFPNDTHALDKPQTEFEQWLNLAWWLGKYAGGEEQEDGGEKVARS